MTATSTAERVRRKGASGDGNTSKLSGHPRAAKAAKPYGLGLTAGLSIGFAVLSVNSEEHWRRSLRWPRPSALSALAHAYPRTSRSASPGESGRAMSLPGRSLARPGKHPVTTSSTNSGSLRITVLSASRVPRRAGLQLAREQLLTISRWRASRSCVPFIEDSSRFDWTQGLRSSRIQMLRKRTGSPWSCSTTGKRSA